MKTLNLLLITAPLLAHVASSQTIVVQDTFTRDVDGALNSTKTTTGGFTWIAASKGNTLFTSGGSLDVTAAPKTRFIRNGFLAFTPVDGFIYELSIDVSIDATTTNAANSNFVGIGFTDSATVSNTGIQNQSEAGIKFESDGDFLGLTVGSSDSLNVSKLGNFGFAGQVNTYTLGVVLDTTKTTWEASFKLDGAIIGSAIALEENATITHIGFGHGGRRGEAGSYIDALSYDNFTLTQVTQTQ